MPKRARDLQKRRLGYCLANLDRTMEHALMLRAEFDEVLGLTGDEEDYIERLRAMMTEQNHAQYALLLHVGMMQALEAQHTLEQFAIHAWGGLPDKVERWTNTGADYRSETD